MENNIVYTCDFCGDEKEMPAIWGDHSGDKCSECNNGTYRRTGESYDQEFLDEQRYNREQDDEYERRHRYDERY